MFWEKTNNFRIIFAYLKKDISQPWYNNFDKSFYKLFSRHTGNKQIQTSYDDSRRFTTSHSANSVAVWEQILLSLCCVILLGLWKLYIVRPQSITPQTENKVCY